MTEKLYENNVLLKSCTSKVLACQEKDGRYLVELDKTVFFPEGGGQLSDKGTLGSVKVEHVCEKEGHILHECVQPLEIGSTVAQGGKLTRGVNSAKLREILVRAQNKQVVDNSKLRHLLKGRVKHEEAKNNR